MIFHDSNAALFGKLQDEHKKAQIAIKDAERYTEAIAVPSLKELRDALHHTMMCIDCASRQEQEAELYKAISHCKRSYFDSKECVFQFLMCSVNAIKRSMGGDLHILNDFIPNYPSHKHAIREAERFSHEINGLDIDSREKYYTECDPHIESLQAFIDAYENVEEEISARRKRDRRNFAITVLGILLAALALVAAL